jgi:hypothetical protein
MSDDERLRELENQIVRVKGELALRDGKIEQLEFELSEVALNDEMPKHVSVGDPMGALLSIYYSRNHLQTAFPEVRDGDYQRLFRWATSTDEFTTVLGRYRGWYANDPWSDIERLQRELDQIRKSAMFRTFRGIARIVDTLFPDGTLRGRLRTTAVDRLQPKESVPK